MSLETFQTRLDSITNRLADFQLKDGSLLKQLKIVSIQWEKAVLSNNDISSLFAYMNITGSWLAIDGECDGKISSETKRMVLLSRFKEFETALDQIAELLDRMSILDKFSNAHEISQIEKLVSFAPTTKLVEKVSLLNRNVNTLTVETMRLLEIHFHLVMEQNNFFLAVTKELVSLGRTINAKAEEKSQRYKVY